MSNFSALMFLVSMASIILFGASIFTPRFAVFSRTKTKKSALITWGLIAMLAAFIAAPGTPGDNLPSQEIDTTPQPVAEAPAPQPPATPDYLYAQALKGKDAEFEARVRERLAATGIEPRGDFEMIKTEAAHDIYAAYRLRQTPLLLDAAKDEARDVLVVMVKELVAMGINPGPENMMVSLRLYEPEEGLTGQNMQRVYGRWRYNPGTDHAEWLPAGE